MTFVAQSNLLDPHILLGRLQLVEGMHVADLGCGGRGHFVFSVAPKVGEYGKVYAVDVLPYALEAIDAHSRATNTNHVHTVWGDLEHPMPLAIPEASIDRVLLVNTLFQTKERLSVLEKARRLLKPKGLVLVVDWKLEPAPLGPPQQLRMPLQKLSTYVEQAGLQTAAVFDAGAHHYGVLLRAGA